jgi:glycosyl transferase family 25
MTSKLLTSFRIILYSFFIFLIYKIISLPGIYLLNSQKPQIINDTSSKGIVVLFINLAQSKDRLATIIPLLNELNIPYIRVEGVDAANLTTKNLQDVDQEVFQYFSLRGNGIRKGEVACFLSHEKAWQTFLTTNYKYALILEDDAVFNPAELKKAITIFLQHQNLWDIIKLTSSQTFLAKKLEVLTLFAPYSLYYLAGYNDALVSYLITRQAANNLLTKAKPLKMPVDIYATRGWELGLKLAIVNPNLITYQHDINSTIINTEIFGKDPDRKSVV